MDFTLIPVTADDIALQKELLFTALWTPDDEPAHPRSALELPHIREYYHNWGENGDVGLFAKADDGTVVGLAQYRYKSCPTKLHSECPELAIAVDPRYQGMGIASKLMGALIETLGGEIAGLRLGVHPKNVAAIKLYEKFGFEIYEVATSGYPQMYRAAPNKAMTDERLELIARQFKNTVLGRERIKHNLGLKALNGVELDDRLGEIIRTTPLTSIETKGKNHYLYNTQHQAVLTINAYSLTVITAKAY